MVPIVSAIGSQPEGLLLTRHSLAAEASPFGQFAAQGRINPPNVKNFNFVRWDASLLALRQGKDPRNQAIDS